ncbi:hypothetical protein BH10PSE7_BH10PSE7_40160 [soil metagenome]
MLFKRFRKKQKDQPPESPQDPSVITRDVIIDGSVVSRGTLHIEGTVHGDIRSQTCVIDSDGVVEGEVVAENVFVRGRVIGPIRSLHVHLYSGAHVEGDIINQTVSIENGAYVYGSIRRSDDPLAEGSASAIPAENGNGKDETTEGYRPIKVLRPR